ncbi:hypothetical protein BJY04DRAFT_102659 [Aspergillus karnatakaensis]|uniref:uncharacterized protein n=1 Tax=Aspergillus karnatakaensis TaxID=1810916 RepID=UPI003CCDF267
MPCYVQTRTSSGISFGSVSSNLTGVDSPSFFLPRHTHSIEWLRFSISTLLSTPKRGIPYHSFTQTARLFLLWSTKLTITSSRVPALLSILLDLETPYNLSVTTAQHLQAIQSVGSTSAMGRT